MSEPIWIPCEGSKGHVNRGSTCSMCGCRVPTVGKLAIPHLRQDILAMIRRGDFDASTEGLDALTPEERKAALRKIRNAS